MHIRELLLENEIEEFAMHTHQRVEIGATATPKTQRRPKAAPASSAQAGDDELQAHALS